MLDESQINLFLQKTRKTAEELELHNRKDLARQVIATGSSVAELALAILHMPKHLIVCHCGRQLKTGVEIHMWQETGECPACDHARGDSL